MSVNRLSDQDSRHSPDYTAPDTTHEPEERPGSFSNDKFDAIVGKIVDRIDDDAPAPPKKDLDSLISEGLDKHEAARNEEESFRASRDARDTLQRRYGTQGTISETLDRYIGAAHALRADPQGTALQLAESYAQLSPYNLIPHQKREKVEANFVGDKRYSGNVLNSIIEDATENASSEKEAFEGTA
jgi:hypothetical protein